MIRVRVTSCDVETGPKSSIFVSKEGIEDITGAAVADGSDECRKVVRKQVGAGADWIKVSASVSLSRSHNYAQANIR